MTNEPKSRVVLTLELGAPADDRDRVEGVVVGIDGQPRHFAGWLALLELLEHHVPVRSAT